MKVEEDVNMEMCRIEEENIHKICNLLCNHEFSLIDYLCDIVSSLCDIDKSVFLSTSEKNYISQTRWFFWYSLRYLTNDSYERIGQRMEKHYGFSVTTAGVGLGVKKMSFLIESEPIWKKRWMIIKRIVKAYHKNSNEIQKNALEEPAEIRVVIQKPHNVNVRVDFKEE